MATRTNFGVFLEVPEEDWILLKGSAREFYGRSLRRLLRDTALAYSKAMKGDKELYEKSKSFLKHE